MTSHMRIWLDDYLFWPNIVCWPAVISHPAYGFLSFANKVEYSCGKWLSQSIGFASDSVRSLHCMFTILLWWGPFTVSIRGSGVCMYILVCVYSVWYYGLGNFRRYPHPNPLHYYIINIYTLHYYKYTLQNLMFQTLCLVDWFCRCVICKYSVGHIFFNPNLLGPVSKYVELLINDISVEAKIRQYSYQYINYYKYLTLFSTFDI